MTARRPIARLAAAAVALAAVSVTGTATAAISVSVSPSRLILLGSTHQDLEVRNAGSETTTIGLSVADYGLTPEGVVVIDPATDRGRSAERWITVTPSTLQLAPGQEGRVRVSSRVPRVAAPGDHQALVLLSGEGSSAGRGPVRVRTRVGIGTLVRVDGDLRRDLVVHSVRLHRGGGRKVFRIGMSNRGNVNERFERGQVTVRLVRRGRTVATVTTRARSLLPGTSGIMSVAYTGKLTGPVRAIATVRPTPAALAGPAIATTPRTEVRAISVRF